MLAKAAVDHCTLLHADAAWPAAIIDRHCFLRRELLTQKRMELVMAFQHQPVKVVETSLRRPLRAGQ